MKKLLPCPFCEESNENHKQNDAWIHCFEQYNKDIGKTGFWAVACTACGMQQCTLTYRSKDEAIKHWNTRNTQAKALKKAREAAKEAFLMVGIEPELLMENFEAEYDEAMK